jgi:hypothetical protein
LQVLRDRFSGPDFSPANLTPWGHRNAFSTLADLVERHTDLDLSRARGGRRDGILLVQPPDAFSTVK